MTIIIAAAVCALNGAKVCDVTIPELGADAYVETTNVAGGVAWRIHYGGIGERTITDEEWLFDFGEDLRCWPVSHAQGEYLPMTLSTIGETKPMPDNFRSEYEGRGRNYTTIIPGTCESPLVVEGPGWTAVLGDAGALDYARTRFAAGERPGTVRTVLEGSATVSLPYTTPWRYIDVAANPSELAAAHSPFLAALNEPCRLADTSWIRPGKVLRVAKLEKDIVLACVDFAVRNNMQYIELDSGWYGDERKCDPLVPREDLDVPGIIAYAKERGIGVILYVNREPLKKNAEKIFDALAFWGVAGVKMGFVNVGDCKWRRQVVEWIEMCAQRRLVVDIHDEFRLAGLQTTYPHVLTAEGIRGNEEMPAAAHDAALVYTRFLDGPGDYTPCWKHGRVKNTLAHQLALPCVYTSGLQFLFWYQRPDQIDEKNPALDFWRELPCEFDETKFIDGKIGEFAVVARRSGAIWFIGCVNACEEREFAVSLDFAGSGAKKVRLFRDADPAVAKPLGPVACETLVLESGEPLNVRAAANGGWCAIVEEFSWGNWTHHGDLGDGTYMNPILPADFSDIDCITHNGRHYAISSTMQLSPGMVVMESDDMVNWRIVGHAVADTAALGDDFTWRRMRRYGRGVWAGALRVKDGRFFVYFGTPDEGMFVCTAPSPQGPWSKPHKMSFFGPGWDDCCPLFDDDGRSWFVATNFKDGYKTYVFEMTPDALDVIPSSAVQVNSGAGREANKLYKLDGRYYHLYSEVTKDGRRLMMQRGDTPQNFTERRILSHPQRQWHEPNQGGFLQDADGSWFFLTHHGHGDWAGRVASLLPVTWMDGWPIVGKPGEDGIGRMVWRHKMPRRAVLADTTGEGEKTREGFLAPEWEWNHSPRLESVRIQPHRLELDALKPLKNGDFFSVPNVLSRRAWRTQNAEFSVVLDASRMADGQRAGICHFGATACEFGVVKENGALALYQTGHDERLQGIPERIHLRTTWGLDGVARFAWSSDGNEWHDFGRDYSMNWGRYRGDRTGLFTYIMELCNCGTVEWTL